MTRSRKSWNWLPTSSAFRTHVGQVISSPAFKGSRRSQQFLQFVVQNALDGHFDELKERNLGIRLFDRDPPTTPPTTRLSGSPPATCANGFCSTTRKWTRVPNSASNCRRDLIFRSSSENQPRLPQLLETAPAEPSAPAVLHSPAAQQPPPNLHPENSASFASCTPPRSFRLASFGPVMDNLALGRRQSLSRAHPALVGAISIQSPYQRHFLRPRNCHHSESGRLKPLGRGLRQSQILAGPAAAKPRGAVDSAVGSLPRRNRSCSGCGSSASDRESRHPRRGTRNRSPYGAKSATGGFQDRE